MTRHVQVDPQQGGDGAPAASDGRKARVLVVDDQPDTCQLLEAMLIPGGYVVRSARTGQDALAILAAEECDAVITDLRLRGMDGIELCERIHASRPDVPVVVMTGFGSLDVAVAAMRAGAYDFISKPIEPGSLELAVRRAIQHTALRQEVARLRQVVAETSGFGELIGQSPEMNRLYSLLARVAAADANVLVTGETGTGKELVARTLHDRSPRAAGPFVAINCAALPASLLESELFGHEKGAFTDAKQRRQGLFLQAHGGTLFLDEVGSLPLDLQPKLLRALEARTVRPVGTSTEIPFDARIITATNDNLDKLIEAQRFREDLFFRINVIHVVLPPLRARGNDTLLLAQHCVTRVAARTGKRVVGLTTQAAEKLLGYSWPGNIRELQNCMERAVALTQYERITVEDLPEKVQSYKPARLVLDVDDSGDLLPMDEVERRYILRVLEAMNGNKAEAARVLGVDRKTLYRKLERYHQHARNAGAV